MKPVSISYPIRIAQFLDEKDGLWATTIPKLGRAQKSDHANVSLMHIFCGCRNSKPVLPRFETFKSRFDFFRECQQARGTH